MSRYGRIESGFWHSRKVKKLSEGGRFLLLYLLSCPHGNMTGCFVLPVGYVSSDLGWTSDRVESAFADLGENGLAERDGETSLIRICGWWGHNPIDNGNQAKAVVREALLLPDCAIKANLIASILAIDGAHPTVMETLSKGLGKGFGKPFRNQNRTEQNTTDKDSAYAEPSAPANEEARAKLFREGKAILATFGVSPKQQGSMIGKWLKDCRDDEAGLLAAIQFARDKSVAEPVAWITAYLKQPSQKNGKPTTADRARQLAEQAAELERGWAFETVRSHSPDSETDFSVPELSSG